MYKGQLQEMLDNAFPITHDVSTDDTSPAFVLQYCSELGAGSASAKAAIDGTNLTLTSGAAGAETTPAGNDDCGSSGVFALATYTNLGLLQDAVNASRAWRLYLAAGLRADTTVNGVLDKTATACNGANGLTFYIDTSATVASSVYAWGFVISGEKFINNKASGWRKDWDAQCVNTLSYLAAHQNFTTSGTLKVYQGKQGQTETCIWQYALTDNTLKEVNASLSKEIGLMTQPGYRLIARIESDLGSGLARMDGIGKTAVMDGTFAVTAKNY